MSYKQNFFVLLFCFRRSSLCPPYSDREISLSEINPGSV
ncbi:hypothetical protein LEP1GSC088_3368 [Leptospira interrogans str. L1207]|nr:hypothetical protein LEP1GSC088_3368 [Leptospira interrogans str. L1207]